METREINVLVLAYLGDTIYENYVRRYLINSGIGNVLLPEYVFVLFPKIIANSLSFVSVLLTFKVLFFKNPLFIRVFKSLKFILALF